MRATKEINKKKTVGVFASSVRPTSEARQNKGITLIALVITIIVMLILVAVTISLAINGGLFEKAGEAVGDTKNAINYEQKLADGRIKIGGKWYASIDDYLNNNPIITGIIVDKETLELKKKESEEAEGEEILTGTITASVFGMDQEPEITWEVSPADQTAVELSGTTGKTITVTAVGTAKVTVTVTAKCTYEGKEYTVPCEVSLKILKALNLAKGAFVEYDVAYTDSYYSNYNYTTTNGWRLLDYTSNGDGTISNVKLISTGIPALLKYTNSTVNNSWYVTDETKLAEFREMLGGENYTFYTGTSRYYGLEAAAGMYYNFGDIKFAYSGSDRGVNLGSFTSITTKGTTYGANNTVEKTGNDLFKVRDDVKAVRLLTLKEVNEAVKRTDIDSTKQITDSIGLYRLNQISSVTGMSDYTYSRGLYWLASPYPDTDYYQYASLIEYRGLVYSYFSNNGQGVRPVIILDTKIHYSIEVKTDSETEMEYLTLTAE